MVRTYSSHLNTMKPSIHVTYVHTYMYTYELGKDSHACKGGISRNGNRNSRMHCYMVFIMAAPFPHVSSSQQTSLQMGVIEEEWINKWINKDLMNIGINIVGSWPFRVIWFLSSAFQTFSQNHCSLPFPLSDSSAPSHQWVH